MFLIISVVILGETLEPLEGLGSIDEILQLLFYFILFYFILFFFSEGCLKGCAVDISIPGCDS